MAGDWPHLVEGSRVKVATSCFCGNVTVVEVDVEAFKRWQGGLHVQHAFPELDANARERLISGTCAPCWAEMFGSEP